MGWGTNFRPTVPSPWPCLPWQSRQCRSYISLPRAIESGDVILMSGDLRGIVNARHLSRRTLATIRLNFFWAYAYNVVLIPVAAGVLYPLLGLLLNPMLAAAAMSVSSVFVVTNSLRLRRFRAPLAEAHATGSES